MRVVHYRIFRERAMDGGGQSGQSGETRGKVLPEKEKMLDEKNEGG
jgi:hypothetical protein